MIHLGERITSLVDGQLGVHAAERAVSHLAECPDCQAAVEAERLTKLRLCALSEPCPGGELMARLLEMAGPSGPLPPRPGHVPGSPRAQFVSTAGLRPPLRRGSSRPADRRTPGTVIATRMDRVGRSRTRMAAAMVGAVCLVGAGVAGGVAHGGVVEPGRPLTTVNETSLVAHSTGRSGSSTTGGLRSGGITSGRIRSGSLSGSVSTSLMPMNDQTVLWRPVSSSR